MQIYIAKSGQQAGPFSDEQIQSMLNSDMVALTDSAWHEGLPSWVPLHQVLNVPPPLPSQQHLPTTVDTVAPASSAMFLYIPTARLVAMSIISLGLYEVYWIYRKWRYLKERDGLRISPFWRGVFGIFFIRSLLKTIKNDATTNSIHPATFSPGFLATGWIFFVLLGNAAGRIHDPAASFFCILFSIPSFCFLLPVQNHIKAINEAAEVRPAYYRWSSGHIVCLVYGVIVWFLLIVGLTQ